MGHLNMPSLGIPVRVGFIAIVAGKFLDSIVIVHMIPKLILLIESLAASLKEPTFNYIIDCLGFKLCLHRKRGFCLAYAIACGCGTKPSGLPSRKHHKAS